MPVRQSAENENFLAEFTGAALLAVAYLAGEFLWDLLGAAPDFGRSLLALSSAAITWMVVRATIPHWPVTRRLLLCLAICATLDLVVQTRVQENMTRYGTVHSGSDDSFYLSSGSQLATVLSDAGNLESYVHVYAVLPFTPHIGFIVLIGHLFHLVPADDLNQLRAVVLLNLFTLQWLAALVVRLGRFASHNVGLVLGLLLLPGFDLFYFAAEARKDSCVVLLTIALTVRLLDLTGEKANLRRVVAISLFAASLFFLRNFYVAIPPAAILLTRLRAQKGSPLRRFVARGIAVLGLAAAVILVSDSVWFQEVSVSTTWTRKIAETGWAAQIYNVPLAGPVIYALITPLPPRLTELTPGVAWTDAFRSLGMLAILALLGAQTALAVRTRAILDKHWSTFFHLGVMIFLLSAYGSLEPRHRLTALPCIMVCYGIARQRGLFHQTVRTAQPCSTDPRAGRFSPAIPQPGILGTPCA